MKSPAACAEGSSPTSGSVSTRYGPLKPDPAAPEFAGGIACLAAIAEPPRTGCIPLNRARLVHPRNKPFWILIFFETLLAMAF